MDKHYSTRIKRNLDVAYGTALMAEMELRNLTHRTAEALLIAHGAVSGFKVRESSKFKSPWPRNRSRHHA